MDPITTNTDSSEALYYSTLGAQLNTEDDTTSPPADDTSTPSSAQQREFTFLEGVNFEELSKALNGLSDEEAPSPSEGEDLFMGNFYAKEAASEPASKQNSPVPKAKHSNSAAQNYGFLPPDASSSDIAEFLKESAVKRPVSKFRYLVQKNVSGKQGLVERMKATARSNRREATQHKAAMKKVKNTTNNSES